MYSDLISKAAVLKIIEDIKNDSTLPKNYGTLLDIINAIRKLPVISSCSDKQKIEY